MTLLKIIVVAHLIGSALCEYDRIIKSYVFENEILLEPSELVNYSRNVRKFLTGGLHEILLENVPQLLNDEEAGGSKCHKDIATIYEAARESHRWALQFLDSSSSSPPGLLEATQANFGDFDQCLTAKSPSSAEAADDSTRPVKGGNFNGKYFQFYVFREPFKAPDEETVSLNPGFLAGSPIVQSECLPSSCTAQDVFPLVTRALEGHPLRTVNDVTATTRDMLSLAWRAKNMTREQKWSLAFVITICLLGALGSFLDCKGLASGLGWFSLSGNARGLFFYPADDGSSKRISHIDAAKVKANTLVCMAHAIFVMDFAFAPGVFLSNLKWSRSVLKSPTFQLYNKEGAFPGFAFMGYVHSGHSVQTVDSLRGVSYILEPFTLSLFLLLLGTNSRAFHVSMNIIGSGCTVASAAFKDSSRSLPLILLNKILRYLPGIICLLALELLWPFLANGPLYQTGADYNLQKCQTYWYSVFFVSNLLNAQEFCSAQTYYISVDLQLCLIGILVAWLMRRRPRLGISISLLLTILGNYIMFRVARIYKLGPTINNADDSLVKTNDHVTYIHNKFYSYLGPYFAGLVVTYGIKNGYFLKRRSISLERMTTAMVLVGTLAPLLHNKLELISEQHMPWFIVSFRTLWNFIFVVDHYLLDFSERREKLKRTEGGKESSKLDQLVAEAEFPQLGVSEGRDGSKGPKGTVLWPAQESPPRRLQFNLLRGLATLSFSVFLVNYYVIRTDVFVDRDLFRSSYYSQLKKWMYIVPFVYIAAFAFHVLLLAPFEHLRNFVLQNLVNPSRKDPV